MGVVFDARDLKLQRNVALKVMLRNHSGAEETQRFHQEARVLGQLAHPNIVPIYDVGTDEHGQPFYTMKLVQGRTLHDILGGLKTGDTETVAQYPLATLLIVFLKVCDAVAFAHSRGIIHRDLKPQNVMVGEFGEVLVMDWGLAKILSNGATESVTQQPVTTRPAEPGAETMVPPSATAPGEGGDFPTLVGDSEETLDLPTRVAASAPTGAPAESPMTMEGTVMGTPHYMSPEQAAGLVEEIDQLSDVFALGGMLYALLTLQPPVQGKTHLEILAKVQSGDVVPPNLQTHTTVTRAGSHANGPTVEAPGVDAPFPHLPGGRVPDALSAVAMRALKVDRSQRYPSVKAFAADLAAYQGGFATSAERASLMRQLWLLMRRHRVAAAALAVVMALSIGFVSRLIVSERRADQNAAAATKAKEAAQESSEAARQALARSQISLAEAAYRELDSRTMIAALEVVPPDLRDGDWAYLRQHADNSQARFPLGTGLAYIGVAAHPKLPGIFALASMEGAIHLVDARTGQRTGSVTIGPRQTNSRFFRGLDFSPDGKHLLVGCLQQGGVSIYDAASGQLETEWDAPQTDFVRFDHTGKLTLDINVKQELTVRDAANGRALWTGKPYIRALFTAAGQLIASDGIRLQRLDATTGAVLQHCPHCAADSSTWR